MIGNTWLIRILLTSLFVYSTKTEDWPYCGNFAYAKGYPLGCKSSSSDSCVVRSDECKTFVCDNVFKQFEKCGDACNLLPYRPYVEVENLKCWCYKDAPLLCNRVTDLFTEYKNELEIGGFTPNPASVYKTDLNIWGGTVQLKEGDPLLPVFCYDKKDTCGDVLVEITTTTTTRPPTTTRPRTTTRITTTTTPTTTTTTTTPPTTLPDTTSDETTTESTDTTTEYTEPTPEITTTFSTETTSVSFKECSKIDQYGLKWECRGLTHCRKTCPLIASGLAFWECGAALRFKTKWPEYDDCHSSWITELDNLLDYKNTTYMDVMIFLDQYLNENSLFGHEMMNALNYTRVALDLLLFEQSESNDLPSNKLHQQKYLSNLAVEVVNKLLALEIPLAQLNETEKIDLGREMLDVAETFGFTVTQSALESGHPYNMSSKFTNYQMEAQYIQLNEAEVSDNIVQFPLQDNPLQSSIKITKLPLNHKAIKDYVHLEAVGSHMSMESTETLFPAHLNNINGKKKRLNAGMISMTLRGPHQKQIHKFNSDRSVIITFRHERMAKGPLKAKVNHELFPGEEPTAIQGTAKCVYWNALKGENGQWDTEGCQLVNSTHWYTTCECNHLSSFALLMDVHDYIATSLALEVLGIVCSSLSVICLALTIIVLYVLKLDQNQNSVGKHLCICLMIGHVMALIFLDRTYFNTPQDLCVAVGVFTHYIFLAAFMWMTIEGHNLYLKVVRVFDSGRDYSRLYLIFGYGTPLIIVAFTGIITASLQDTGYANDELCWLSTPGYVWAFMGPVLCLITVNLLVFVVTMKVAISASNKQKKKLVSKLKIWIRGWFSLSALLGLTWFFGFLYIQVDPFFAYIFVILNGCQGVLLFLTRVILNKKVRLALKQSIKRRELLSQFYGLSKSTTESRTAPWKNVSTATTAIELSAASSQNVGKPRRGSHYSSEGGYSNASTFVPTGLFLDEKNHDVLKRKLSREDDFLTIPTHTNNWHSDDDDDNKRRRSSSFNRNSDLFYIPEEDY